MYFKLILTHSIFYDFLNIEFSIKLPSDNRHLAATFSNGVNNLPSGAIYCDIDASNFVLKLKKGWESFE